MKAYFKGDKDVLVFEPIPQSKRGRPRKDVPVIDVVKTNADHIRSMTDEEIAEFIYYHKKETCFCCELTETDGACTETLCVNATLHWLKQPYKEDA